LDRERREQRKTRKEKGKEIVEEKEKREKKKIWEEEKVKREMRKIEQEKAKGTERRRREGMARWGSGKREAEGRGRKGGRGGKKMGRGKGRGGKEERWIERGRDVEDFAVGLKWEGKLEVKWEEKQTGWKEVRKDDKQCCGAGAARKVCSSGNTDGRRSEGRL
jgi:hypothetical protein